MRSAALMIAVLVWAVAAFFPAASGYVLDIYGNANLDEYIDENDIAYSRGVIEGTKASTNLSDANYDGKVDSKDIDQIEKIINGNESELIFRDSLGKVVTVKMPVEKVAILSAMASEALQVLKAGDKVVGVDKSTTNDQVFYPYLSKKPVVGTSSEPDIEAIVDLRPDIVICTGSIGAKADKLDDKLVGTGVTVVRMDFYKDENMRDEIETLGYLLNKRDEARAFVDFYEGYLKLINDRVKDLSESELPKVYMESHNDYTAHSIGTGFNTRCAMAGGMNMVARANLTGGTGGSYPVVDAEWVIGQNPDIIIKNPSSKVVSGYSADNDSEMKAIWDAVKERPELANVSAIKNDRIYVIAAISGGPKVFICTVYMAKWFHPELFKDLDPQSVHQEYLTRFIGLDYDLKKHGVFVYPRQE